MRRRACVDTTVLWVLTCPQSISINTVENLLWNRFKYSASIFLYFNIFWLKKVLMHQGALWPSESQIDCEVSYYCSLVDCFVLSHSGCLNKHSGGLKLTVPLFLYSACIVLSTFWPRNSIILLLPQSPQQMCQS